MIMQRNVICSILIRDNNGYYRRIFSLEGDKKTDNSLYIVKANHDNKEVHQDEQAKRRMEMQLSYHSRVGKDGLVQTHHKRAGNRFGITRQIPLVARKRPLCIFHSIDDVINKYPIATKISKNDIKIDNFIDNELNNYKFVFYLDEIELLKLLSEKELNLFSKHIIPAKNIFNLNFAIVNQT